MEEFFLGSFLSDKELNIVYEKNIQFSILSSEFRRGNVIFITDTVDKFVNKGFGGNIANLGIFVLL